MKFIAGWMNRVQMMSDRRALFDSICLILLFALTVVAMIAFDGAERFYLFSQSHGEYELDDIALAMTLSSFYMVFFIYRRMQDLKARIKQANTDALVGIYNRRKGAELIKMEVDRANLFRVPFSIIMLDVDHFKQINDKYGHDKGDQVLKDIIKLTQTLSRRSDVLIRWGGEEFVISCPSTQLSFAIQLAERIRTAIAAHDFNTSIPVTASFGVSEYLLCENVDDLLIRADKNMYRSKKAGRNRVNADQP